MSRMSLPVVPVLDGVVVTAAGVEAFECPVCAEVRDLVVPACDDAPHDECPDRACAVCGFALSVGGSREAAPAVPLTPRTRRAG